jgi:hypothetical protein
VASITVRTIAGSVAAHTDQIMLEQRILTLEADMQRLKQRLDIGSDRPQ